MKQVRAHKTVDQQRHLFPAIKPFSLLLFACLIITLIHTAPAQVSRGYQLKAVFLFNFAQFTEWPSNAIPAGESIVIGVLGTDPFGSALDEVIRGEIIHGRSIAIQRFRRVEDVQKCHVLFISQSEASRLPQIVSSLKGRPILTVSDIEGSAFAGVMIRLITESNRIRLRINTDAVKEAGLTLSSKLLRAAELVPPQQSP